MLQPALKPKAKGLATVALLKVYYDERRDYIGMFLPFVIDVIRGHESDDFEMEEIRAGLVLKHGFNVPGAVLQTILKRIARKRGVRREGGRYFRNPLFLGDGDLSRAQADIEREHAAVSERFLSFASSKNIVVDGEEAALGLLLRFLEENHVAIIVDSSPTAGILSSANMSHRESAVVAAFLQQIFRSDPEVTKYVLRMLEGLVLSNTLLLKDIALATRKFSNLTVFFDTGFLLHALGLAGEAAQVLSRETLDLLRATNARLAVFERTIDEIKRILSVYERHLRTPSGILSLRPTDVTSHLLRSRYSPSDVAEVVALLETNLGDLGFKIKPYPQHESRFTLDEQDLTKRLQRTDGSPEHRVIHDVDCTAAILTLREGSTTDFLEDARAIFATNSNSVVSTVADWYRSNGARGVAPAIHIRGLSNVAWLKKPNLAGQLKQAELVAACSAALHPDEKTWNAFVRQLKKLKEAGALTSDESVAIVVQGLTEPRLIELEGEGDKDADTISEIIERVKADYKKETDLLVKDAAEKQTLAEGKAVLQEERRRQLELAVDGRLHRASRTLSYVVFFLVALILGSGAWFSLPTVFPNSGRVVLFAWFAVGAITLFSFFTMVFGFSLQDIRLLCETRIMKSLKSWFVPLD